MNGASQKIYTKGRIRGRERREGRSGGRGGREGEEESKMARGGDEMEQQRAGNGRKQTQKIKGVLTTSRDCFISSLSSFPSCSMATLELDTGQP